MNVGWSIELICCESSNIFLSKVPYAAANDSIHEGIFYCDASATMWLRLQQMGGSAHLMPNRDLRSDARNAEDESWWHNIDSCGT